mmetsp:Transcript_7712/g.14550  ORF Transcript_7712/g.14550 Transcript_7712/m.14550 type:complete len:216 (+) Transcript_7712:321-968(+)
MFTPATITMASAFTGWAAGGIGGCWRTGRKGDALIFGPAVALTAVAAAAAVMAAAAAAAAETAGTGASAVAAWSYGDEDEGAHWTKICDGGRGAGGSGGGTVGGERRDGVGTVCGSGLKAAARTGGTTGEGSTACSVSSLMRDSSTSPRAAVSTALRTRWFLVQAVWCVPKYTGSLGKIVVPFTSLHQSLAILSKSRSVRVVRTSRAKSLYSSSP